MAPIFLDQLLGEGGFPEHLEAVPRIGSGEAIELRVDEHDTAVTRDANIMRIQQARQVHFPRHEASIE